MRWWDDNGQVPYAHWWNPTDDQEQLAKGKGRGKGGGNAEALEEYWLHGEGAAKIRWGTKNDWRRCNRHLRKYLGEGAKGYCQKLHKKAVGFYTGDEANK